MLIAALLLSAAPGMSAGDGAPLMEATTRKSMDEFSQCFIAAQDRQGHAWWMVPGRNGGGRISNDGAQGVANPYYLRFSEGAGRGNAVELRIASRDPAEAQRLSEAVRSCA